MILPIPNSDELRELDALLEAPAGHTIGVLGLGVVGRAMARHLASRGASVVAADLRETLEGVSELGDEIQLKLGPMSAQTFAEVDALAISPGAHPQQVAVQAVRERGKPVFGELELCRRIPARVVAITGTNGKSTTTALIGALVRAAGLRAFVGGNLGEPIIDWIDNGEPADVAVIELSSFQLETAYRLDCDVAIVLNLTPDHNDRYDDLDDYGAAKQRITQHQVSGHTVILNADDSRVRAMASTTEAQKYWFGRGDFADRSGARIDGDMWSPLGELDDFPTVDMTHERLFGTHNRENAAAAFLAVVALGLPESAGWDPILSGYRNFAGLEHRLELVGEVSGVRYINDSKATNDSAAAVAVRALEGTVVLLVGGQSKGAGYADLLRASPDKVEHIIAFGAAAHEIRETFQSNQATAHIVVSECESLAAAVESASRVARSGQAVLLAPACASFDEFRNYAERGREFKERVMALGGAS